MRKRVFAALLTAVAVMAGAEVALPPLVASRVTGWIRAGVDSADRIRVTCRTFPAVRLLAGHVGRLEATGIGVTRGPVRVQRLDVTLTDVRLDMRGLLGGRPLRIIHMGSGSFAAELTERDLCSALAAAAPAQVSSVRVSLGRGQVVLEAVLTLGDLRVEVATSGSFRIDGTSIVYDLAGASVGGREIPAWVTPWVSSLARLSFDLSGFPIPLRFQEVRVMPGRLTLLGGSAGQ